MEYDIVKGCGHRDFVVACNTKISEGWVPQGGVSVTGDGTSGYMFCQAFLKNNSVSGINNTGE